MEQSEITYATVDKIIGKTGNFLFPFDSYLLNMMASLTLNATLVWLYQLLIITCAH